MKANEAPNKVYLHLTTGNSILNGKYYERKPAKIRNNDKIIEYTRTDALIEKACDLFRRIDYDDTIPPYETTEEFIKYFKKYMKEE